MAVETGHETRAIQLIFDALLEQAATILTSFENTMVPDLLRTPTITALRNARGTVRMRAKTSNAGFR